MVSCITSYIPLRPRTKPAVTLKVIVVPNAFIFTISVRIFIKSNPTWHVNATSSNHATGE